VQGRVFVRSRTVLKKTLLSGYLAQAYASVVGLLLMPVYLRIMGVEAFGLIGIFLMLQAWAQLLDMGLTPTFSRELSRLRAGTLDAATARSLLRGLSALQLSLALASVGAIALGSHWIAAGWLESRQFSTADVAICVVLMAIAAALRWLAGLFRAGMVGLEQQHWVNATTALVVTLRFVGVVPVLMYLSRSPLAFFAYQVAVGGLEYLLFRRALLVRLPAETGNPTPRWTALRSVLPLAGSMAFMTTMWILQTQVDKLVLSKVLSLAAYGNFTLAMLVAGGMLMLMPPLSQVIQPRMSILAARGEETRLAELYSLATQFATVLFFALGVTVAVFAGPLLFAWTGDRPASDAAAPTLFWYGLSNAVVGVLTLPFMLQFAYGKLRIQMLMTMLTAIVLLPALVYMSVVRGAVGAGQAVFAINALYLALGVPWVHHKLGTVAGRSWLRKDFLPVALATSLPILLLHALLPASADRWAGGALALATFAAGVMAGVAAGGKSREFVLAHMRVAT